MEELLMEGVTTVISVIIPLLVVYFALPWIRKRVGEDKFSKAKDIVMEVCKHIEESKDGISEEEKKKAAFELSKKLLKMEDIKIKDDILEVLIDSAEFLLKKTVMKEDST